MTTEEYENGDPLTEWIRWGDVVVVVTVVAVVVVVIV